MGVMEPAEVVSALTAAPVLLRHPLEVVENRFQAPFMLRCIVISHTPTTT